MLGDEHRDKVEMPPENHVKKIRTLLRQAAKSLPPPKVMFYKTGIGQYAEHDKFLGISVPFLRKIAQQFYDLSFPDIQLLISSPINEERLLALLILGNQYRQASTQHKNEVFEFYLTHLGYVNNWNLVDGSAPVILGPHLQQTNKKILFTLARSNSLWERRIAIVATWHFIRQNDFRWTMKIAQLLLKDPHDLIHKATGWMLREVGKRNIITLTQFLDQHAPKMPRTMLRYAIEKLPERKRKFYLSNKQL